MHQLNLERGANKRSDLEIRYGNENRCRHVFKSVDYKKWRVDKKVKLARCPYITSSGTVALD